MGGNGENRLKLVMLETFPFTLPTPPTPIILSSLSCYISPWVLIPSTPQVSLSSPDSTYQHSSHACLIQHFVNHVPVCLHSVRCPLSLVLSPPLIPLRVGKIMLVSHPGTRLIHAAPGSHLPREITRRFNRTGVSNSLHSHILTHARKIHTWEPPGLMATLTVTSVFGVKRHLTSLSVTHTQRRTEGENETEEMGQEGWLFSLQLISHITSPHHLLILHLVLFSIPSVLICLTS